MVSFERRFCFLGFLLVAVLQGCTVNNDCACPDLAGAGAGGSSGGSTTGGTAGAVTGGSGTGGAPLGPESAFSFFVTSLRAMRELSGNEDGFGGDLRFGETGPGAGLSGADKICTQIAEKSAPDNGKVWRAFLSVTQGADGVPVHAIERVGEGPWYDRRRRLVAQNLDDLAQMRPRGADPAIANDLPNEDGVPNHAPDPAAGNVDNHDTLTGSNETGHLFSQDAGFTCQDWTSAVGEAGRPRVGHSWTRALGLPPGGGMVGMMMGENWMSTLTESGCAPGAFIVEAGPPGANGTRSVGDGGGYGGIYCLALTP
ncbi:MAG TPA: hypothetical protein VG937_38045 [Polyangiaceae bacterium]|nr:hypothetical protein [Polyangiaceae bacterium]